ncbi:MAG: carbohydrate ABC transporter permease [Deltaproteobacteria bacterium]|nr:MAG: carbohydrate ABC transporter permease [Deltaproteobacteria bacterium]
MNSSYELSLLRYRIARILVYVALLLWLAIAVYPFIWVVLSSLKKIDEYFLNPLALPTDPQWWHFPYAWTKMRFQRYLFNSAFVSIASLIGSLWLSSMVAFVFARFNFRFKGVLWGFILFSFLLPGTTALFPLVVFAQKVGLYGSLWALVLIYSAQSVPWNTFFLRSAMEGIPRELEEAAVIDGASTWQVFWRIMIPLSGPALATMGIFSFLYTWGDFMLPIMLAKSDELFTIAVGALFLTISGKGTTDPTLVASGLLISVVPVLIIYIFLQRYVVKGLTAGALKGI